MSIRTRSDRLVALLLASTLLLSWGRPARADDELEASRERFRVGYEKYKAHDFAGAIVDWEAIYRELGAERGYRLAFNLARAYDAYGDYTRAAESYESYLGEVARRKDGPALEPLVAHQADEAEARLKELAKSRGRVKVRTSGQPVVVQVDSGEPRVSGFTAYVTPGAHTITWNPATAEERKVEVRVAEGELEIVEPPAPPVVPRTTPPARAQPLPPSPRSTVERPLPVWTLYAGGAATVVSVLVPLVYYEHASTVLDRQRGATTDAERQRLADDYDGARSDAYVSWVLPSALATVTLGLTAYYFLGGKEKSVTLTPTTLVTRDAAHAGLVGRF